MKTFENLFADVNDLDPEFFRAISDKNLVNFGSRSLEKNVSMFMITYHEKIHQLDKEAKLMVKQNFLQCMYLKYVK